MTESVGILANGLPIRLAITAGETHDAVPARELLSGLQKGQIILADKAYDADWIRHQIEDQGATPNIPSKANRKWKACFSPRP
jgi:transposase